MRLRTLLRNGGPLSLLFSIASALFLSPRGWYPLPLRPFSRRRFGPVRENFAPPCFFPLSHSFPPLPPAGGLPLSFTPLSIPPRRFPQLAPVLSTPIPM